MTAPIPKDRALDDPLTDPEAAAAFTKRHAWTPNWSYQRVSLVQPWDGRNKGKPLCRASVHDGARAVSFHQCPLPGKTQTADGTWWCRVHEPAALAARKAAQEAKYAAHQAQWSAKWNGEQERARKARDYDKLAEALRQIADGHNDPRSLAAEVLAGLGAA